MKARLYLSDARAGRLEVLAADRAHYLVDVLRLRAGDAIEVFDGRGHRFAARIEQAERRQVAVSVGDALAPVPVSPLRITLVQALAVGDKMDLVVEKACELGVTRIVPVSTERSAVRLDATRAARRVAHWRRIVEAACMQCGRDELPAVDEPRALGSWLADDATTPARHIVLSPDASLALSGAGIDARRPIVLLVGPESGLSPRELEAAGTAGYDALRLGHRTLRTETAGLAALAALQALAGDF